MTNEQELLARAMNRIDDDMILSAHAPHKKVRRVIPVLVAACLIVVLAVSFPYLREVINTNSDLLGPSNNDDMDPEEIYKPSEELPYTVQDQEVTLGGTTLTLTDVTETSATFTVVKTDDTPIYALLYDRLGGVLASTEPDYTDNGVTIRPNTVRVYTNGADQPGYRLPTTPGTYEVTVDFAFIRNGQYPMQEFMGLYAYIGKDETPVTILFSLEVKEMTTEAETASETNVPVDEADGEGA